MCGEGYGDEDACIPPFLKALLGNDLSPLTILQAVPRHGDVLH